MKMKIETIFLRYYFELTQEERDLCTTSSFAKGTEPTFESLEDFKEWAKDILENK